jgi:hypothetical protein
MQLQVLAAVEQMRAAACRFAGRCGARARLLQSCMLPRSKPRPPGPALLALVAPGVSTSSEGNGSRGTVKGNAGCATEPPTASAQAGEVQRLAWCAEGRVGLVAGWVGSNTQQAAGRAVNVVVSNCSCTARMANEILAKISHTAWALHIGDPPLATCQPITFGAINDAARPQLWRLAGVVAAAAGAGAAGAPAQRLPRTALPGYSLPGKPIWRLLTAQSGA